MAGPGRAGSLGSGGAGSASVSVLGLSQTDHPGWGTRVETRDFCREDGQTSIQQHGAGGEGSFPLLNTSQSYSLPVTALLYQKKSDPEHTLSSSSSGTADLTQKSYYLPQTFPGYPGECRKLPSYFFWDWIKLFSPQTFNSMNGEIPKGNNQRLSMKAARIELLVPVSTLKMYDYYKHLMVKQISIAKNLEIYGTWRIEICGCIIFRIKKVALFSFYVFVSHSTAGSRGNFLKEVLEISSKVV